MANSTLTADTLHGTTPLAEEVHARFQASSKFAMWLRRGSISADVLGAVLAVAVIFRAVESRWSPILLFVLALLSLLLRMRAVHVRSFAHRCRKASLRSFASGNDLSALTLSNVQVDTPVIADWLRARCSCLDLHTYYEPLSSPGSQRLRELYAHSAFYTWSILGWWWRICLAATLVTGACAVLAVYWLAIDPPTNATALENTLDAIYTVFLVAISLRLLETTVESLSSSREIREIESKLVEGGAPDAMHDLVDAYDIERAAGSDAPTWLYKRLRDTLQQHWHVRRDSIVSQHPPHDPANDPVPTAS